MKKTIFTILAFTLLSSTAFADSGWSTFTPQPAISSEANGSINIIGSVNTNIINGLEQGNDPLGLDVISPTLGLTLNLINTPKSGIDFSQTNYGHATTQNAIVKNDFPLNVQGDDNLPGALFQSSRNSGNIGPSDFLKLDLQIPEEMFITYTIMSTE